MQKAQQQMCWCEACSRAESQACLAACLEPCRNHNTPVKPSRVIKISCLVSLRSDQSTCLMGVYCLVFESRHLSPVGTRTHQQMLVFEYGSKQST